MKAANVGDVVDSPLQAAHMIVCHIAPAGDMIHDLCVTDRSVLFSFQLSVP
jgi:hypothetical protein